MDFHRWSALWRGFDLSQRYNQVILVLSIIGAAVGFLVGGDSLRPRIIQGVTAGATVFAASALAKELGPDRLQAAPLAAAAALPFAGVVQPLGIVALFWLLGCIRLINRTSGARPKLTDTFALLIVAAWLSWRGSPLFGILLGIVLLLDALLPEGRQLHAAVGLAALIASGVWLLNSESAAPPETWLVALLLLIAVAFIPIILNSYRLIAVDDDGGPLTPSRVQAGQAVALSAGLFLASWLGRAGLALLIGLWAALLGILIHHLVFGRLRRSVAPL